MLWPQDILCLMVLLLSPKVKTACQSEQNVVHILESVLIQEMLHDISGLLSTDGEHFNFK